MAETPVEVPEDFESFWYRDRAGVMALAAALTGDWAAAEDLAQDAFAAAHRSWERIDNPSAWIRRVVANNAVSRWRKQTRESAAYARVRTTGEPVALGESDDAFWDAVRALPKRQAQVVALHYLDDLAVADIATVLGIAEGTVKATLSQARASLARALECTDESEDAR